MVFDVGNVWPIDSKLETPECADARTGEWMDVDGCGWFTCHAEGINRIGGPSYKLSTGQCQTLCGLCCLIYWYLLERPGTRSWVVGNGPAFSSVLQYLGFSLYTRLQCVSQVPFALSSPSTSDDETISTRHGPQAGPRNWARGQDPRGAPWFCKPQGQFRSKGLTRWQRSLESGACKAPGIGSLR